MHQQVCYAGSHGQFTVQWWSWNFSGIIVINNNRHVIVVSWVRLNCGDFNWRPAGTSCGWDDDVSARPLSCVSIVSQLCFHGHCGCRFITAVAHLPVRIYAYYRRRASVFQYKISEMIKTWTRVTEFVLMFSQMNNVRGKKTAYWDTAYSKKQWNYIHINKCSDKAKASAWGQSALPLVSQLCQNAHFRCINRG